MGGLASTEFPEGSTQKRKGTALLLGGKKKRGKKVKPHKGEGRGSTGSSDLTARSESRSFLPGRRKGKNSEGGGGRGKRRNEGGRLAKGSHWTRDEEAARRKTEGEGRTIHESEKFDRSDRGEHWTLTGKQSRQRGD